MSKVTVKMDLVDILDCAAEGALNAFKAMAENGFPEEATFEHGFEIGVQTVVHSLKQMLEEGV